MSNNNRISCIKNVNFSCHIIILLFVLSSNLFRPLTYKIKTITHMLLIPLIYGICVEAIVLVRTNCNAVIKQNDK